MATEGNIGFAQLSHQQANGGIILGEPPLSMAASLAATAQSHQNSHQHHQHSQQSAQQPQHQNSAGTSNGPASASLTSTTGSGVNNQSNSGPHSSLLNRHLIQQTSMPTNIGSSTATSATATLQESSTLRLSNLPTDLSKREAQLIFALVIDDILSIEFENHNIVASFKTLNTCITTGKLLEGKSLFGPDSLPLKVEFNDNQLHQQQQFMGQSFNSLRISTTNISPPQSDYQKRQSMGSQRSRFLFGDPFSTGSTPSSATAPTASNSGSGRIDLSDLTGKSLLLLESQNDAREYDQLVRDPWKNSSIGSATSVTASAPQTPAASTSTAPFDWNQQTVGSATAASSTDRRRTSSAFFNSANASNLHNSLPSAQHQQHHSILPQPFSNVQSGLTNNVATISTQQFQQPPQAQTSSNVSNSTPNSNSQVPTSNTTAPASTVSSSQSSVTAQKSPSESRPTTSQTSQTQTQVSGSQIQNGSSNGTTTTNSQTSPTTQQAENGTQSSTQGSSNSGKKDIPDLSLLARVPPPANPADQNPPCNTLYVGNLPPDATEAELRALFSPQKGFRRLSFRTKISSQSNSNSNSHNHGPMCFVEFEDVAHATRALAELYGSALPRPGGSSGKGGIRLSFSKNPLGVRGPGNPRRTSNTQGLSGSSNNSQSSSSSSQVSNSTNNIGNYGYSGFHKP